MNNSSQPADYAKEQPPDLIKNLLDPKPEEKKCEKTKFKDKSINVEPVDKSEKPEPQRTVHPAGFDPRPPGILKELSHTGDQPGKRRRKVIRALFCAGWIFCCPCFVLGKCLRESPDPEDDDEDEDPCVPWKYKV